MKTAKTITILANLLLAASCNGEVMLLTSYDGGGGDAALPDGSIPTCEGVTACPAADASPNPDDATSPGYPDAQSDWWNPPTADGGWYDDAPFQDDATLGADVACPLSDDAGNCSRFCCEATASGPAWAPVPVSLPCTYADWVCQGDTGTTTDDAATGDDAGCDHWCCEPPPGGRGYPTVQCEPLGVTCTLPAADCESSDAGWGD
jgi:hypothetical protein